MISIDLMQILYFYAGEVGAMSEKNAEISFPRKADIGITTYSERDLHRTLKRHFCSDEALHELKIGRYVADACVGGMIYEIQTASLSPLSKKLKYYLEETDFDVTVVRPIAKDRRILWLDPESGELASPPRLSSKHETVFSGISELFYIRELLGNGRLSVCFLMMEIDEVRLLDGYGKYKKIRATSVDRIAGEIYSEVVVDGIDDVTDLVFAALPEGEFSREELAKSLGLGGRKLWSMQKLLVEEGILECRRDGKRLLFRKMNKK